MKPLLILLALSGSAMLLLQRLDMFLSLSMHAGRKVNFLGIRPVTWLGDILAFIVGMQFASLFFLLCRRFWAALILALLVEIMLVVLNRTKEKILREPLTLADAWLLGQIFKYPHLYFPFLPTRQIITGICLTLTGVGILLYLEPRQGMNIYLALLCINLLCLPLIMIFTMRQGYCSMLAHKILKNSPVGHNPLQDAASNGALASALLHPLQLGLLEKSNPDFLSNPDKRPKSSSFSEHFEYFFKKNEYCDKHIIIVQAESFCDIRTYLSPEQQQSLQEFMPGWDELVARRQALPTPETAFGAYTMRTEFSMLTGLQAETLGPWWHNPYLLAARRPLWSLARHYATLGYETICVHPYAKDFFQRDKVMPNLGFSRFIGLDALKKLDKFGPYTSDKALGEFVMNLLGSSEKLVFCFIITMEAHGPWLPDRLSAKQIHTVLQGVDTRLFNLQTQMYLCHLKHMDNLLVDLDTFSHNTAVNNSNFPASLWCYGDHPPHILV